MDIRGLIIDELRKKDKVKISDIVKKTGFSRAYIHRFFLELKNEGKVILIGKANNAHYILSKTKGLEKAKRNLLSVHRILQNTTLSEDLILNEIKKDSGIFVGIPQNISNIVDYAFTEMLNNAIEHSQSKIIDIVIKKSKENIQFSVVDKGVGIFNNIMEKKNLENHLEAIQDLIKGKQTTLPEAHSGEGIFFTSKVADIFIVKSAQKKLIFDNIVDDIFIKDTKSVSGTKVFFSIQSQSKKELIDVFNKYTDDDMEFSKTNVQVKLYKRDVEYISRSQARRIIARLDKFKTIELDFKNVETVGQGFADEIFRVWQAHHPETRIIPKNANENITFMIKRVVAT
jgi:anti-sigma regulatory factor (Ser/Thr protein kinase)